MCTLRSSRLLVSAIGSPVPETSRIRTTPAAVIYARQYSIVKDQFPEESRSRKSDAPVPASQVRLLPDFRLSGSYLVGLGRIELPTSPLSGVRSSQLSYRPKSSILVELVGIEPATS